MKFLLDTHILIWSLQNNNNLSQQIRDIVNNIDNEIYVSAASIWEIAIKSSINKLNLSVEKVVETLHDSDYFSLPITFSHAAKITQLPYYHNDPFDRILIAQTLVEKLTFITHDHKIKQYNIPLLFV
jgi:PIN domain nuclease of toxin-antitoxin system